MAAIGRQGEQGCKRLSLWWWDEEAGTTWGRELSRQFYSHMFIQDLTSGLHSYRFTHADRVSVSLEGGRGRDEDRLSLALPAGNFASGKAHRSLCEAIGDYIDAVASAIAYYGLAYLEFAFAEAADEDGHPGFELVALPHGRIEHAGDVYRQWIPHTVSAERRIAFDYVEIPADRILKISMPSDIMPPDEYRRLLRELVFLSQGHVAPSWEQERVERGEDGVIFDYGAYRAAERQHLARLTAPFGWNARSLLRECATECYMWIRHLRMLRAKARLREHILSRLNDGLKQTCSVTGIDGPVLVSGCVSSEEVEAVRDDLAAGNVEFRAVVELEGRF